MKESALYHLMQLRARQLQESLTPEQSNLLAEIQQSLKVERTDGGYCLQWRLAGQEYNYRPEIDNFSFYIKGDSNKKAAQASDTNYRSANWQAAYTLWQEIYRTCGLDSALLIQSEQLAFVKGKPNKQGREIFQDLFVSTPFAVGLLFLNGAAEAMQVLIGSMLLLRLAACYEMVHLRIATGLAGRIILVSGVVMPVWLGVNITGLLPLLLALYLVCLGERYQNNRWFAIAGALFALCLPYLHWIGASMFVSLLVLLMLLHLVDRKRLPLNSILSMTLTFMAVILIMFVLVNRELLILPVNHVGRTVLSTEILTLVVGVFLIVSLMVSGMWWISGVQYYLIPWFILIALFVTWVLLWYMKLPSEQSVLVATGGFTLFGFTRVLAGLLFPATGKR